MSVKETECVFVSGAAVSVGGVGSADKSFVGGVETDEVVNFAAFLAHESCVFVKVLVPERAWGKGSPLPLLCRGEGLPLSN